MCTEKKYDHCLMNPALKSDKTEDTIFESFGFHCMGSRYAASSNKQVPAENVDIEKAETKCWTKLPSGAWDFGHLQEVGVTEICKLKIENAVQGQAIFFLRIVRCSCPSTR